MTAMTDSAQQQSGGQKQKEKEVEPQHSLERLISHRMVLLDGVSPHAIYGALSGRAETAWTADEAKSLIEKWLNKEVKADA